MNRGKEDETEREKSDVHWFMRRGSKKQRRRGIFKRKGSSWKRTWSKKKRSHYQNVMKKQQSSLV